MRGFIQIPFLIAFLVGAVIFGGGGYYMATKAAHPVQEQAIEIAVSEDVQVATSTEASTTSEQVLPRQEQEPVIKKVPATQPAQPLVTVDVCTNLNGEQAEVPTGMILSRDYGCVTEKELDKITAASMAASKAAKAAEQKVKDCMASKALVVDLNRQREVALTEHNALLAKIQKNSAGVFAGALNSTINDENNRYFVLDQSLILKLGTAQAEAQSFCS